MNAPPSRRTGAGRAPTAALAGASVVALAAVVMAVRWGVDTLARHRDEAARARGEALYSGQAPLPGRLAGHEADLPGIATRCGNCHEAGRTGLAAAPGDRYAVGLSATRLTSPQSRRGGPASVYDAASLCRLLRTGVDPAQVMIDSAMPRYQPSDDQCQDLWKYLLSR